MRPEWETLPVLVLIFCGMVAFLWICITTVGVGL